MLNAESECPCITKVWPLCQEGELKVRETDVPVWACVYARVYKTFSSLQPQGDRIGRYSQRAIKLCEIVVIRKKQRPPYSNGMETRNRRLSLQLFFAAQVYFPHCVFYTMIYKEWRSFQTPWAQQIHAVTIQYDLPKAKVIHRITKERPQRTSC